jgi:hypothetical protein
MRVAATLTKLRSRCATHNDRNVSIDVLCLSCARVQLRRLSVLALDDGTFDLSRVWKIGIVFAPSSLELQRKMPIPKNPFLFTQA